MHSTNVRSFGALIVAALVAACGGDGGGPTGPDNGGTPPPTRVVKANPSFGSDVQEIFERRGCTASQCHGASPGQANLNLSQGASYAQLVNIRSTQEPAFDRVVPNDAQNSYLVIKVEGRQSVGVRMPQGGSALDTIDINNIRNWINTGAANN